MTKRQFLVLYRDFLFSIVDRELLSTHAKGDASQLLLQLVALLVYLSVCFCVPVLSMGQANQTAFGRLSFAWSVEHFLIATTMLIVGIFAVLSWDRLFPSQRDVLVLGPLPVRAHTILLARFCAVATALGLTVFAFHVATGAIWPLALNGSSRGQATHAPQYTYDAAMSPVAAADLQAVLEKDLADAIRSGPLAPGAGGGVSIGIYQRGVRRIFTYGAAAPDSIFQIGSATKPFTGVLLADMAEKGAVRLDEPVRELIPAAGLSRPAGNEITLLDLATHHSGLPGIPANFRPADRANPAADFDVPKLYAFVRSRGVEKRPDAAFRYSNLGFGLLGHAISRRAGIDYATLLRQVITGPLGMNDTVLDLSPEQQRRLLQGYNDYRRPIPAWDFDVLAGAGGLRSTAPDMLTWLEANLHPERVRAEMLSAALVSSHHVRSSMDSRVDLALAWWFHPDSGVFEHAGALLAFTADGFFNPKEDIAAIVLSNVGPGTAVSADALGEHVRARLDGKPAVSLAEVAIPPTGSVSTWIRLLIAYWLTMIAAGVFVFGLATNVQGLAAAVLPRRYFARVSSWLQLATFCLVVGMFFLQPMLIRPEVILAAQNGGLPVSSPSLWFLGLFQALSGSPALAPLSHDAWLGLGLAVFGMAIAYALSYTRALRQFAEHPDTAAPVDRVGWLPALGTSLQAAVVHFSLRTVFRSPQHRVILAFYWGIAFALVIIFVKSPGGRQLAEVSAVSASPETSVPLLMSSVIMMAFAVLAGRLVFAMPRDLPANWIFRVIPARDGAQYTTARRRALIVLSAAPVWTAWAVALFWLWPRRPALGHLVALAFLGMTLVEVALIGAVKIPCTCSYLPGKSHLHLAVFVVAVLLLPGIVKAARLESDALQDPFRYAAILGILCVIWIGVRWVTTRLAIAKDLQPTFDDEPAGRAVTLELWDSRFDRLQPTRPARE
jgi:CubicO group peptidase (beta-lactamase class C family)